jgi:hypothetical protein
MQTQTSDKRNQQLPIPKNFADYLTLEQELALSTLCHFGWRLKFIRRPLFKEPTVVLSRSDHTFGILERDGRIHDMPTLRMRNWRQVLH